MIKKIFIYGLIIGCTLLTITLTAATITPNIEQKAIDALKQEQNRQQEMIDKENYQKQTEQRWRKLESLPSPYKQDNESTLDEKPAPTTQIEPENCLAINKITLIGIEKFPLLTRFSLQKSIKLQTKKLSDSCVSMDTLATLVSSTNKLLFNKGYVTSRAHIIEQDISDGIFEINITAGIIKHYQLEGLSAWQAALIMPDSLLNYNYLNNGLDNLKRLPSNLTSLKIIPGDNIGESYIQVDNVNGKIWQTNINIKNDHSDRHNYASSNINLVIDNIFRSNELWSFSINESLKERSLQKNQLLNANIFLPIRRSTIELNTSTSSFYNHIEGNNIIFKASGESKVHSLNLNYLAFKNTKSTLNLSWEAKQKSDLNRISDATIDIQSGETQSQARGFDYKIILSDTLKAQIKSTYYEGSFKGYDIGIETEEMQKFQRYLHQGVLSCQKHAWNLQADSYLQESHSALINDQRFSLYTTFIPGIVYIPAQEGKLNAIKASYTFQFNNILYVPEIQLSHSELKNINQNLEISGVRLRNTTQWERFSSVLELGKPIKSPQKNKDFAGSISFNLSF